jgi:hypothetical protein
MAERIAARHRQTAFTGILAARLFADAEYHGEVGIHYAGPTWESHSGGKVIASRLEGCTPDPTAIPWLLLQTVFFRILWGAALAPESRLTPCSVFRQTASMEAEIDCRFAV